MAGLLEEPSAGEIVIGGTPASSLSDSERTRIRRDTIGFVYQAHHLLPEFTALENVVIPQLIAGRRRKDAKVEAARLLTVMGLENRMTHRPSQLSGGEQQRVAIARALANGPRILLADEPNRQSRSAHRDRRFRRADGYRADGGLGGAGRHPQPPACRQDGPRSDSA